MREKSQGFVFQDDHNRDGHGDRGKRRQKQGALDDAFRQVTSGLVGETGWFLAHERGIPENLELSGEWRMLGVNYDNSMTAATDFPWIERYFKRLSREKKKGARRRPSGTA